ncbi:hypothetical protein IWQ60_001066 [Tieghemiomyces parasiticus]|uniref:Uncharacterized protein n=1 Tax=Tieghemiomyces parasiticus TaxID=78921 RepID=A0A9W8E278_9FUNG|nr:hypothetical protein IWQ60_001066 [Tieghemiomyces parasiticus]
MLSHAAPGEPVVLNFALFQWTTDSALWLALGCLIVAGFCTIERFGTRLLGTLAKRSGNPYATAGLKTLVYAGVTAIRYMLMLAVMSRNIAVFVTVVVSLAVGQFATEVRRIQAEGSLSSVASEYSPDSSPLMKRSASPDHMESSDQLHYLRLMCVAFFLASRDGPFKFVMASNRDEYLDRSTRRADWWEVPHTHVLAPRDLGAEAHGTWLGINRSGHVANLTNSHIEVSERPGTTSRGVLVRDFLLDRDNAGPLAYLNETVAPSLEDYNGFSLVVGDVVEPALYTLTNRGPQRGEIVPLPLDQIVGLSNGDLVNTADWPRIQRGTLILNEILHLYTTGDSPTTTHTTPTIGSEADREADDARQEALVDQLFAMLRDTSPFTRTFPPMSIAEARKPICLPVINRNDRLYGTTVSTVVLVDQQNRVLYHERDLVTSDGQPVAHPGRRFEFILDLEEASP